ncbi:MAG: hypothetical protein R3242_12090 [Akkermansiaceae bacterium]|nr:hypothetical protein [Akkermansiaceae bacterium]
MKLLATLALITLLACAPHGKDRRHQGWYGLRWVEQPSPNGPSHRADPQDRTRFFPVCSFDQHRPATFQDRRSRLREGDVIAYWMKQKEASRAVTRGEVSKAGYGMLSHGHLAIVVQDPRHPNKLHLFSSQSFKGPNIDEDIDTLADHSWDAFRLDKWQRINKPRFHEFIELATTKAGNWRGYDFTGMFGLWNDGIEPTHPDEIGSDYICSTIVVAALHYAGLKLDAVNRDGVLDLISPKQVISSRGCIVPLPEVELEMVKYKREDS